MRIVHSFNELYAPSTTVSDLAVFNVAIKGSSYLSSIRVSKKTGDLVAEFTDGAVFGYDCGGYDAAQAVMDAVLAAPSRGKFFYRYVRTSFPFHKIKSRSPYRKRRSFKEKVADWVWRKFR